MLEPRKQLKELYTQLERVAADVAAIELTADVNRVVQAPRTIGPNVPVTFSTLIEHLLVTWLEWRGLSQRLQRYVGDNPDTGKPVDDVSPSDPEHIAKRWLLHPYFTMAKPMSLRIAGINQVKPFDSDHQAFHVIIEADLQEQFARVMKSDIARSFASLHWQSIAESYEQTDATVRHHTEELLLNYRRSMLRLSWLEPYSTSTDDNNLLMRYKMNSADSILKGIQLDSDTEGLAQSALGHILETVNGLGYEQLLADVRDDDGSTLEPRFGSGINMIPSKHKGNCSRVLVALSSGRGRTGLFGFDRIMQQVKTHLIDCRDKTKLAVIFCDTWESQRFIEDHLNELRAHHRQGVRFVFLMVGIPSSNVSPIATDLS